MNSSNDNQNIEKCSICMQEIDQEVGSPNNCDHKFCSKCLQNWAREKNTCPLCRQEFQKIIITDDGQGAKVIDLPLSDGTSPAVIMLDNPIQNRYNANRRDGEINKRNNLFYNNNNYDYDSYNHDSDDLNNNNNFYAFNAYNSYYHNQYADADDSDADDPYNTNNFNSYDSYDHNPYADDFNYDVNPRYYNNNQYDETNEE